MSDLDAHVETITEGSRALKLFTDRYHAIRLFLAYLHDNPAREQVLFFHGDGGNGKSLLLRFLYTYCCQRLRAEEWEYVRTVPNAQLESFLQNREGLEPLPYAYLDFSSKSQEGESPQDPFVGLLMLRRQLAQYHMRFPFFDYACVWYLSKTGQQLTPERLRSLFPAAEMDVLTELILAFGATTKAALAKVVLNLISKHLGERFTLYLYRRKLDETMVDKLHGLEAKSELLNALPGLFAADLNTALMALPDTPSRLVLFFDSHEAFWGVQERENSRGSFFGRDEWLRKLVREINRAQGIVVVVAGRDQPRWAQASREQIRATLLDTQLVAHLSAADAMMYLAHAGITDPTTSTYLVRYAEVEPGQSHPLYLGLCADVVLAAAAAGVTLTPEAFPGAPDLEVRATKVLDRLLYYADTHVEYAVRGLSACRAFNREIYVVLGNALGFQTTTSAFQVLCGFSFVWHDEMRADGWYRIHNLVRQLVHKDDNHVTRDAHEALERYYRARAATGDPTATAEAIYHVNQLDWERGIQEWVTGFETALRQDEYTSCRALLVVRSTLTIETDAMLGEVSQCEGEYFFRLAQYEKARQEFTEAIAAYDDALRQAPDHANVHTNKGRALHSLGAVHAAQAQYPAAVESYRAAIAACDEALRRVPDHINAHTNKSRACVRLGDVQAAQAQYPAAIESYGAAIAACDEVLRRAPEHLNAHNNKGWALTSLGDVQAAQAQYPAAIESYGAAIVAYDDALRWAPDYVYAHNNKGNALASLGAVQAAQEEYPAAIESYGAAIAAYDDALRRAPEHVDAHSNKGAALASLGAAQAAQEEYPAAIESYGAAIAAYDDVLRRAPEHANAHSNKGWALASLGDVQAAQEEYPAAIESYGAAIAAYDDVLRRAPDFVDAHRNKGVALASLGAAQAAQAQYPAAIESYGAAIAACDEVRRRAPDYVDAHYLKGMVYGSLGEAQTVLKEYPNVIASYQASITACDEVLRRAPEHVDAHSNKGWAYIKLGDVHARLAQYPNAIASYQTSIVACDEVLRRMPDHVNAHRNKGVAYARLESLDNINMSI